MPPKTEISKESVLKSAFEIVKEEGFDALTARSIATELGCSTQPIYSAFGNMDQVKDAVYDMAVNYALESMNQYVNEKNNPALNLTIGYLYFAKNEKHLFRTIYLSGYKKLDLLNGGFVGEELCISYMRYSKRLNTIEQGRLRKIFLKLSIYLIGIGTMINTGTVEMDIGEIIEMIKEMFETVLLGEGILKK